MIIMYESSFQFGYKNTVPLKFDRMRVKEISRA